MQVNLCLDLEETEPWNKMQYYLMKTMTRPLCWAPALFKEFLYSHGYTFCFCLNQSILICTTPICNPSDDDNDHPVCLGACRKSCDSIPDGRHTGWSFSRALVGRFAHWMVVKTTIRCDDHPVCYNPLNRRINDDNYTVPVFIEVAVSWMITAVLSFLITVRNKLEIRLLVVQLLDYL